VSQRFSTETSERSSQNQNLHPTLQAALASLDVQLDEELARYRRQRVGRSTPPARGLGRNQARNKSLDLISISATGGRTQPQTTSSEQNPVASPADGSVSNQTAGTVNPSSQLAIATQIQSDGELLESRSTVEANRAGELLDPAIDQLGPDDYLESSEELLRSLAEEEAKVRVERNFIQSLLTPLGVGSMLLLVFISTAFGYIVMNPSSLTTLSFGRGNSGSEANRNEAGEDTAVVEGIPSALNLSQREFRDLNLDNLSMAKGNSTESAIAARSPEPAKPKNPGMPKVATPESRNNEPVIVEDNSATVAASTAVEEVQPAIATAEPVRSAPPARRSAPTKTYTPPTPRQVPPQASVDAPRALKPVAPAPVAPAAPAPAADNSGSYRYKVVTPYENDQTLEKAREAVPDAYVRNLPEGAQVQMGAYPSEAAAQEQVQQLQKQGISAEVYRQ
jgi:hypothetical protein